MSIKDKLKELRRMNNQTQKSISTKLNIVESAYANWEQGRTEPNIEAIKKLCVIFNVSADELLEIETTEERKKIIINNLYNNNNGKQNIKL